MATYQKFDQFMQDVIKGVHNFGTHTFKAMLTNTAPTGATNQVKGDITEIAAAGTAYPAGGVTLTVTVSRTGAVTKVTITDYTLTANAATGPFRYIVIYNDSVASPVKPLVGFYDYGSNVTLAVNDTFLFDFDGTNGFSTFQ